MDLELIKKLIQLLEKSELDQMEIEEEGFYISLQKHGDVPTPSVVYSGLPPSATPPDTLSTAQPEPSPAAGIPSINAPMVGTFYRAPAPDAPPYVEIGDTVSENTVVCILEAMKVMNEIKAGMKGTIVNIPVENAQPVEFGQPMFMVKPTSV